MIMIICPVHFYDNLIYQSDHMISGRPSVLAVSGSGHTEYGILCALFNPLSMPILFFIAGIQCISWATKSYYYNHQGN